MSEINLDELRLEIEKEKLEIEKDHWERDFSLREKSINRVSWSNPIVIAIFTAAMAITGNIILAFVTGYLQRDSDKRKSEQTLVTEMIKTDAEKAVVNLRFLIDTGLLTDPVQTERIRSYLDKLKPGQGPSLPPPGAKELPHFNTSLGIKEDLVQNFSFSGYPNDWFEVLIVGYYAVKEGTLKGHMSTANINIKQITDHNAKLIKYIEFRACYTKPGVQGFDVWPKQRNKANSIDLNLSIDSPKNYELPSFDFAFPIPTDDDGKMLDLCAAIWNEKGYIPVQ